MEVSVCFDAANSSIVAGGSGGGAVVVVRVEEVGGTATRWRLLEWRGSTFSGGFTYSADQVNCV